MQLNSGLANQAPTGSSVRSPPAKSHAERLDAGNLINMQLLDLGKMMRNDDMVEEEDDE